MHNSTAKQTARLRLVLFLLTLLMLAVPVIFTFYKMGRFYPAPTVTVRPAVTDPQADALVFAADYDFEPYSYYDQNGNPSGLNIELATELANRMNRRIEIRMGDWPECKRLIKSSEADVLLGLEIFADESKTSTLKTIPVSHDEIRIYGKNALPDAGSLYGKKVGIAAGSIIAKLFELNCQYTGYQTNTDILRAVENGEVDYGICHASVAAEIIAREGFHLVPSVTLMESFPAFGIRETAPELLDPINLEIKKMSDDGTVARLYSKWLAEHVNNRSFKKVAEDNFSFYITYLVVAIFIMFAAGYMLSILGYREENLRMALSYQKVLEEKTRQAEAASKAKSTFLFNMSHDIRTPMNAILGFNDIAIRNIDDREKALDALRKARFSSEHMLSIINDILDMSRIESGKMTLSREIIDVRQHFSSLEEMFRISMEQKNLRFVTENAVRTPYIYGDYLRITQVIANLLSNAMKFTKPGGTVIFRALETGPDADGAGIYEVHVIDNGIGMSEEFKSRLFQTFERESTPTISGVQGTGLGLSNARNLAELMGGSLTCSSTLGKGTEFVFSFKAEPAEAPAPAPQTATDSTSLAGRRILLVEDNELNREIAAELLRESGFVIETAENGAEAVKLVSASAPGYYSLILMDIQMPVMDGYEATRQIRALGDPALRSVPIAAMTANAFASDRAKALECGMNAHIAKPFELSEMLDVIRKLLV